MRDEERESKGGRGREGERERERERERESTVKAVNQPAVGRGCVRLGLAFLRATM